MSNHQLTCLNYSPETQQFEFKSTIRALNVREVLIKTTHSGLCFTDVHAKPKRCGLGHEGVGTVAGTGGAVTNLKIGDRAGWGWLHSSCGSCPSCLSGYRQYCAQASGFAFSDLDQGAFGDYRIIDAEFAYKIPDAIASVHAAPLMCAGASVYEALDAAATKPSDRVGVVGVGGLGHMAVLFAKAMGCGVSALFASKREPSSQKIRDVFALGADEARSIAPGFEKTCAAPQLGGDMDSSTPASSRQDRMRQRQRGSGRHEVQDEDFGQLPVLHGNPLQLQEQEKKINVLLVCSNELPEWDTVLPLLDRMARIVLMSIQSVKPLRIPYMPFILPGHRIIASTEASKRNHIDMLDFAARNGIQPWVERFPMTEQGLADAFGRLENGQMRYRGVLEWTEW